MLALTDGPRHGYAIRQGVEDRTGGAVTLGVATLYEAIQRLQDARLIREVAPAEPSNGQEAQRRFYELTDRGWRVLAEEVAKLRTIVEVARKHPRLA
jgi:DNA-binding PadR family transcriptional regulator